MHDPDTDRRQSIGLFRNGLIADLLPLPPGGKGRYERLAAKAALDYTIPGSRRTRVAAETLRDWLKAYRRGGFEALLPKERADRGQPRALPAAVAEALLAAKEDNRNLSVQRINGTYRRTGPLFEERFRSSLIDAEGYLLACQRYIELNPVRARMVAAPSEYPWSSYRANALGHRSRVITTHPLYQSLGASDDARQAAYRRLFETELDARLLQRLRESANGGFVLGTDRFARQNAAMVGRRTWKGSPGRPRTRPDDQGQGPLPL